MKIDATFQNKSCYDYIKMLILLHLFVLGFFFYIGYKNIYI